ncbi:hypothetical protein [Pedobacter agri]|uniref:hypothetical protein n=1 Tax=Pedobacter agri TaxID=454586 RepID=UPI002930A4B4|nr:hypothetical protein [Pedobacter agri]
MKNIIIIFLLLFSNNIIAQQTNTMKKSTSGMYGQGSQSGIYIYDDGTFALFGYATLVLGKYTLKDNQINFVPDIPKQIFTILGRKNPNIKIGVKLTFSAAFLNDGPTYIKLDNGPLINTFDEDYDGGSSDYITELPYHPKTISLAQNTVNHLFRYNTNTFNLSENNNDFMLFYHRTISEQKPFSATYKTEKGKTTLQSRWGEFRKFETNHDPEFETFLNNYRRQAVKEKDVKVFYFNDQLKTAKGFNHLSEDFSIFDINNYVLDEVTNKFIHKNIYKKGTDYSKALVSDYHDESYILKYYNIDLNEQSLTDFGKVKVGTKALFENKSPIKN